MVRLGDTNQREENNSRFWTLVGKTKRKASFIEGFELSCTWVNTLSFVFIMLGKGENNLRATRGRPLSWKRFGLYL